MLNTQEAEAAVQALPRASAAPIKERPAIREANRIAEEEIKGEFKEWLASEYGPEFTPETRALVWQRAWSDGHHAGFPEVERYYEEQAEFIAQILRTEGVS